MPVQAPKWANLRRELDASWGITRREGTPSLYAVRGEPGTRGFELTWLANLQEGPDGLVVDPQGVPLVWFGHYDAEAVRLVQSFMARVGRGRLPKPGETVGVGFGAGFGPCDIP